MLWIYNIYYAIKHIQIHIFMLFLDENCNDFTEHVTANFQGKQFVEETLLNIIF